MLTLVSEAIEKYAEAHTREVSPLLQALREETFAQMQAPQMQVGPLEGQLLKLLARLIDARRILEIGMFTGYSALMMAEGMADGGQLITCDINPKAEAMARRYFAKSPHGKKIAIRMGPALETLKTLEGPLDMVFIDADKESYSSYYEGVLPLVRRGGLVVADNVLWSGQVLDPQDNGEDTRALRAFNELVQRDPRVENVMLTVRDGMMLAWKR